MLGPVGITSPDGQTVMSAGTVTRALLASLALAAPGRRSIEALADDLWGENPPRSPRGSLQTLVSRLRSAAGTDLIRSDVDGYSLTAAPDLVLAENLDADAGRLDEADPARLALLDEALALWNGSPGADLGHAPVAVSLADTASAIRTRLTTSRARTLLALGRADDAVAVLSDLAASHPYDEPLHLQLMTALAAADRPQESLAVFAALRERLRDELGSDPGPATTALNTQILQGERMPMRARVRIGLLAEPNPLIGRDRELREVEALLARARLVTLLGAGGLGKTRLARAVAASSAAPVVVVVPLAGIRDDDDLAPAIADALGVSEARAGGRLSDARVQPDLRSRVVALLSERPTLLVLDNCEQIITGAADWITDMLAAVPTLRILTTSRAPIAVAGEAVHPVTALSTVTGPGAEHGPAVQLFLDRARAVRPDAVLNEPAVIRLCERLDGLPLAIELAAARVRTMSAEQIEERLDDRFALLRGGDRSAPDRHRTLEAVIEWSWELLDPEARGALTTLSLLPAGFSAATAVAVLGTAQVDDLLDRLVEQSLLAVVDDPLTSSIRFRMLETVREFGITRLAAEGRTAVGWNGVLAWAAGFTEAPGASLFGAHSPLRADVFREIQAEHENLLAALRHAIDAGRAHDVLLIAVTLTQSWVVRGTFTELVGFAPAILQSVGDLTDRDVPVDALMAVLLPCSLLSLLAGSAPASALRVLARLRLLRRRATERIDPAWRTLSAVIDESASPERMRLVLEQSRADADLTARLMAELLTSQFTENDGDAVTAAVSARRAWQLAEQGGHSWLSAMAASSAAQLASQSGDPEDALIWFERAQRGFEAFGADDELRQLEWTLGGSLVSLGRLGEAAAHFERLTALQEFTQDGLELAAIGWFGLAEVRRAAGDAAGAIAAYEQAIAAFRSADQRASPWFIIAIAGFVCAGALDGSLPDETLTRLARRLRTRMLALRRMRPEHTDMPVLGTALVGWSAWAIGMPETRERAVTALALAETFGARQDLPSLQLAVHRARAITLVGADAVAAARAAASDLSLDERTALAFDVLEARPL